MNSNFFHAAASSKKKQNKIQKLQRGDGTWAENQQQLCEVGKMYFDDLFCANGDDFTMVIGVVDRKLVDNSF